MMALPRHTPYHTRPAAMADAPCAFKRLRHDPLACLPALLALAMATASLPARAHIQLVMLCSGAALPVPGQPQHPDRECDSACHAGCSRDKRHPGSGR